MNDLPRFENEIETYDIPVVFRISGNRTMGNYLNDEIIMLARLQMADVIRDSYDKPNTKESRRLLVSLERFSLANYGSVYDGSKWVGWGWQISQAGEAFLSQRRPRHYGCMCEYAIVLPCVCSERTFCPNLEHSGNGCHGSHD